MKLVFVPENTNLCSYSENIRVTKSLCYCFAPLAQSTECTEWRHNGPSGCLHALPVDFNCVGTVGVGEGHCTERCLSKFNFPKYRCNI